MCRDLEEIITEAGLKPKLTARRPEMVGYCSAEFIPCTRNGRDTYVLTTPIERTLSKFSWTLSLPQGRKHTIGPQLQERLVGNAKSDHSLALLPISRVLHAHYATKQGGKAENVNPFKRTSEGTCAPSRATEEWFTSVYGVDYDGLAEAENHFNKLLKFGRVGLWSHPQVDAMLAYRRSRLSINLG